MINLKNKYIYIIKMYEYILIIFSFILVMISIIYAINIKKEKLYPYTTNTMNEEVFCINLVGDYFLSQITNGQLVNGYRYATSLEINNALQNGMIINGVKSGDIALYMTDFYYNSSRNPNGYITNIGDFSNNTQIVFNPSTDINNSTYWVFIKGYKPDILYSKIPQMIFETPNANILSYIGVLPWNSSQLYCDAPLNDGKNEVFLVKAQPMPINYNEVITVLNNGYTLATVNQINWCISRGMSYGYCGNVLCDDGNNNLTNINIFPGLDKSNYCGYDRLAIWGVKPAQPNYIISTITTTITNFNDKKYSLYDK